MTRDGTDLAVLDYGGTGPPVVLLHGLAGHAGEWVDTADLITDRFRVIAADMRGHGQSERFPSDLSPQARGDDAAFIIEQLGLDPVTVVGHSLGGQTALMVAAHRPDLVADLVLVEAGPGRDDEVSVRETVGYLSSWPVPFASRRDAEKFLGGSPLRAARWADGLESRDDGLRPRFDVEVLDRTLREAAGRDYWGEWEAVRCPILLVTAENGILSQEEIAEMAARNPNARSLEIPAAGHDLHLEDLNAWNRALSAFLDS